MPHSNSNDYDQIETGSPRFKTAQKTLTFFKN